MTWIPIAGAALSAVGSIASGISQSSEAKRQAAYADANADLAEQQAGSQAQVIREKARRLAGESRAAIGASGVDLAGSFLDALADSDIDAELDAQTALWNGKLEAMNYRAQAKSARAQGRSALIGGFFGAGTSAISGYGNWHEAKARADIDEMQESEAAGPLKSSKIYPNPHAYRAGF